MWSIDEVRTIRDRRGYAEVDGVLVDMQSANAIVTVYDALSVANKARFRRLSIGQAGRIAWQLVTVKTDTGVSA